MSNTWNPSMKASWAATERNKLKLPKTDIWKIFRVWVFPTTFEQKVHMLMKSLRLSLLCIQYHTALQSVFIISSRKSWWIWERLVDVHKSEWHPSLYCSRDNSNPSLSTGTPWTHGPLLSSRYARLSVCLSSNGKQRSLKRRQGEKLESLS